jgi:glycosyltransferase involved in cell wall biosynthesis
LQVIEPFEGGHHSNYILELIPAMNLLIQDKILSSVYLTVTEAHAKVLKPILSNEGSWLQLDPSLAQISPSPSPRERYELFRSSRAASRRVSPDAVLYTSADYDIVNNAFYGATLGTVRDPPFRTAGILHYGYPAGANLSMREKVKRSVYEVAWRGATYDELLMVNPVVYEGLKAHVPGLNRRTTLLPDPVPRPPRITTGEARQRLGIPIDGPYIGYVGMMDQRKAVPELVDAFAQWTLKSDARLVLAGRLLPQYRAWIDVEHGDLVSSERILVIDKELSADELLWGYAAMDVLAILQYRRFNLSANVLKAVSFGKPIVVDAVGHAAMVAERFGAGFTCDVNSTSTITGALTSALEAAENYSASESTKRLIEFHDPLNYCRVALGSLCGSQVARVLGDPISWEWVCANTSGEECIST